jgi:hypothetical protein
MTEATENTGAKSCRKAINYKKKKSLEEQHLRAFKGGGRGRKRGGMAQISFYRRH